MANIVIRELLGSDNITTLTEKINFNFDQLLVGGGGPVGPQGVTGPTGPVGPKGDIGTIWLAGDINDSGLISSLRNGDLILDLDGKVYTKNGLVLDYTDVDLKGPQGEKGDNGDGYFNIIKGFDSTGKWKPVTSQLSNFISSIDGLGVDKDGINEVDFAMLGRGDNSLLLANYKQIFEETAPGNWDIQSSSWFSSVNEIPRLFILQENNQDNAISINKLLLRKVGEINPAVTEEVDNVNNELVNLSNLDYWMITENGTCTISGNFVTLEVDKIIVKIGGVYVVNVNYTNNFSINNGTDIFVDYGTVSVNSGNLDTPNTSFYIKNKGLDNIILDNTIINSSDEIVGSSLRLTREQSLASELTSTYAVKVNSDSKNTIITTKGGNNLIIASEGSGISPSSNLFVSNKSFGQPFGASGSGDTSFYSFNLFESRKVSENNYTAYNNSSNELILMNYLHKKDLFDNIDIKNNPANVFSSYMFSDPIFKNSNSNTFPFRLGQSILGLKSYSDQKNETAGQNININLGYLGLGSPSFVFYTSDEENGGPQLNYINNTDNSSHKALMPLSDDADKNILGYDVRGYISSPLHKISRAILHPYDGVNINELSSTIGQDIFDLSHRLLPSGSLDLFGTLRIREQQETDNGEKDGYVAINKKDGIVAWEHSSEVNAVPPGSIIMFSEVSGDKFSFFAKSKKIFGATGPGTPQDHILGYTGSFATFIGQGSDELKDYWICNGAVLADERDILITGPYNKETFNGTIGIDSNGEIRSTLGIENVSILEYESNSKFSSATNESWVENQWTLGNGEPLVSGLLSLLNTTKDIQIEQWFESYGYSLPGPRILESKFRLVLPNYFGKFPKMVFPGSTFINSLFFHDNTGFYNTVTEGSQTFKAHSGGGNHYSLNTAFDFIGSPYLQKKHLPDLGHVHGVGTYTINNYTHSHLPGTLNITESGSHRHGYQTHRTGGTQSEGYIRQGENEDNLDWNSNSGGNKMFYESHIHESDSFAGETEPDTHSHTIFGNSATTDPSSNTLYYDLNDQNTFFSNFTVNGQKFFEPPFKGTFFAINLKGFKNPNRENTRVKKFHIIGGAPICGGHSSDPLYNDDMSWYNTESSILNFINTNSPRNHGRIFRNGIEITNNPIKIGYSEFGFKRMFRNDNHSHPDTIYNVNNFINTNNLVSLSPWSDTDNSTNSNIVGNSVSYKSK